VEEQGDFRGGDTYAVKEGGCLNVSETSNEECIIEAVREVAPELLVVDSTD